LVEVNWFQGQDYTLLDTKYEQRTQNHNACYRRNITKTDRSGSTKYKLIMTEKLTEKVKSEGTHSEDECKQR
jgi:hypothetical protein